MGTVCSTVFKEFSCQKLTLANIKIIMKTQYSVILLVSTWTLWRDTLCQQVNSKESADGDEINNFNESFISDNIKFFQGILQNLNIAIEGATERQEDLTLSLEKIKDIRFVLHHGTHSPKTDEQNPSPAELRGNLGFEKIAGTESRKEAQEWLNGINYFAKINEWLNEEKLSVALCHLNRAARGRWLLQLNAPKNWTNFQCHFLDRYITVKSDKLSLCEAVGLDLDQTKKQIMFAILSYEVYLHFWILPRPTQLATQTRSEDGEK